MNKYYTKKFKYIIDWFSNYKNKEINYIKQTHCVIITTSNAIFCFQVTTGHNSHFLKYYNEILKEVRTKKHGIGMKEFFWKEKFLR